MPITKVRIDQWICSDGTPFLSHAAAEAHEKRWLIGATLENLGVAQDAIEDIVDALLDPDAPFIILTKRGPK